MNKVIYKLLILSVVITSLSCNRKEAPDGKVLDIVSTVVNVDAGGGKAKIITNENNISASAGDSWIKPVVKDNVVECEISPNESYDSRTSFVIIKKGIYVREVPITQLGVIIVAGVSDYTFSFKGESKSFECNTSDLTVEGLDESWLSYEHVKNNLIFTAKPNSGAARECRVNVKAGKYYSKTIILSQGKNLPSYEFYIGDYTLRYVKFYTDKDDESKWKTLPVSLSVKEQGRSYVLNGLDFPVEVVYNEESGTFSILGQVLTKSGDLTVFLANWCAGENDSYKLNIVENMGLISRMTENETNYTFLMEPNGVTDNDWKDDKGKPYEPKGFVLWQSSSGGGSVFKSKVESMFGTMIFVKNKQ